ncbi:GTP 3',8-cyclase, partial [Candidatus Hakubella thermalkaliphila]
NISLDSLGPQLLRTMTGGRLEDALKGLHWAQERGLKPIKINVVVLAGINDDLEPFARMSMEEEVYIRFIEYMPLESANLATGDSMRGLSYQEMLEKLSSCGSLRPGIQMIALIRSTMSLLIKGSPPVSLILDIPTSTAQRTSRRISS